jgi:hypothetical protein
VTAFELARALVNLGCPIPHAWRTDCPACWAPLALTITAPAVHAPCRIRCSTGCTPRVVRAAVELQTRRPFPTLEAA